MALHIAANRKGLSAARVRASERFLTRVRVRVDAQRRRTRESLVACAADIPVVVLLVGGCAGGGEVVVVLPGGGDWGDEGWGLGWLVLVLRHRCGGEGGCWAVVDGLGCFYWRSVRSVGGYTWGGRSVGAHVVGAG